MTSRLTSCKVSAFFIRMETLYLSCMPLMYQPFFPINRPRSPLGVVMVSVEGLMGWSLLGACPGSAALDVVSWSMLDALSSLWGGGATWGPC